MEQLNENDNKIPEHWKSLFDIKKQINNMGGVMTFSQLLFDRVDEEELNQLYSEFRNYFCNFPINHPLRMEATKLMIDLGFQIIDDGSEEKTYLDQSLVDEVYKNIDTDEPVKVDK